MAVLDYRGLIRRIRAAQKTQQITKTMQMVSATRLRKSLEKLLQAKPYLENLARILSDLENTGARLTHPFFETNRKGDTALVVVTSDRGLCGTYNANMIHFSEQILEKQSDGSAELVLIGKKGDDYFRKRKWPIFLTYMDLAGKPDYDRISQITKRLTEGYLSGQFNAIHLVYTAYRSAMSIRPVLVKLLPLEKPKGGGERVKTYLEPDAQTILDQLLPEVVASTIYVSILEAFTSENSARMIAMKNATDNAKEMIRHLTLLRNKARQAAITKELLEIVTAGEVFRR
jgi:F-type H+-transporting ATPase subunit gamma